MEAKLGQKEAERQAKRLRELMRNRFSQEIALKLIADFGGEQQALDFLLNENEEDVHKYLHKTPEYLQDLRTDSQNLASILENGFDSSVRMFGCGSCQRAWWKRVPVRKEVSKCHRCGVKYDPIPRNKEWGWGKFICPPPCGNEFTGHATMGETVSVCYKCENHCPVDHILPKRRKPKTGRSRTPHSCNGTNCYNRDVDDNHQGGGTYAMYAHVPADSHMNGLSGSFADLSIGNVNGGGGPAGAYPGPAPPPKCNHPRSQQAQKKKLRYESCRHRSTGSTVTSVVSQNSIETATISTTFSLDRINEEN